MDTLFKLCAASLNIKKPYSVRFLSKGRGEYKTCAGLYISRFRYGKIVSHDITIHLDAVSNAEYDIASVIAHEFIHACQEENNLWTEKYHDGLFVNLAKKLEFVLAHAGYKLKTPIYDKLTDTD